MRAYERLLNYVTIDTPSVEDSNTVPSSDCQFVLANALVDELKKMGVSDASVNEKCYVYASIPATKGLEQAKAIGFISHMDTAPSFHGIHVKPQIHENYDGGDVALGTSGKVLSVQDFKELPKLKGRTLITTDGTTLLGADDKAGIAEIMTMVEMVINENIPHGKICIAFTPDEEIGAGADHFDVERFGADFAYTVDGGEEGEIEYENFNAASAKFSVKGVNVHTGDAKNIMKNAVLIATEINGMLPSADIPAMTEGYEGFYHLETLRGDVNEAELEYLIRDHDRAKFEARKELLCHIEKVLNEKYGEGTVQVEITDSYYNMKEKIEPHMHLIENAKEAVKKTGVTPKIVAIRGGTDGARLSFMGLPCPNLATGGYGFHGPYEHITVEGMDCCVQVLRNLVEKYAQ